MKANDEMSKKGWSGHIGSSPCIGWCHCTWTPFFSEDIYQIGNLPRDQHASNKVRNTRISAAIVSESFPNDFNLQLPMPWNMMKDLCVFMLYVLYCILCIILYIIFYILYILYFILYFLIFYCIYIYIYLLQKVWEGNISLKLAKIGFLLSTIFCWCLSNVASKETTCPYVESRTGIQVP